MDNKDEVKVETPVEEVKEENEKTLETEVVALEKVEEVETTSEVVATEPEKVDEKAEKKAKKEEKRRFGEVMTTGAFVRMFILLLIPGINIILLIFWALGAAKNRNRINLSRGLIIFFLIEVILALIIFGVGYIFVDRKETMVINYLDKYSNGVLTYFDIDSYEDLVKLKGISNYLVDQTEPEEVVIPKTCYVYNPVGMNSYKEFLWLYCSEYYPDEIDAMTSASVSQPETTTDPATTAEGTTTETATTEKLPTLLGVLEANNVDTQKSELIYIIIENDKENSLIIFDPSGKFQSFPTIEVNGEYIHVGGAK